MLYQVIITGDVLEPVVHWQAIVGLAHLFSISHEEAARRFDRAPCVVRGGLNREQAEKYCRVMRRHGIDCEFEPEAKATWRGLYPRLGAPEE